MNEDESEILAEFEEKMQDQIDPPDWAEEILNEHFWDLLLL